MTILYLNMRGNLRILYIKTIAGQDKKKGNINEPAMDLKAYPNYVLCTNIEKREKIQQLDVCEREEKKRKRFAFS